MQVVNSFTTNTSLLSEKINQYFFYKNKKIFCSKKNLKISELVSNCLVYPTSMSLMTIRHCSLFISSNGGK